MKKTFTIFMLLGCVIFTFGQVAQNVTTNTSYTDLQMAINDAGSGDQINLLADIDFGNPFTATQTTVLIVPATAVCTLNFNGHTLSANVNTYQNAFVITNNGTLTLINEVNGVANNDEGGINFITSVQENGSMSTQTTGLNNSGLMNINSGRYYTQSTVSSNRNLSYGLYVASNFAGGAGTVNINGGYIFGRTGALYVGAFNGGTSTLNIHGGDIQSPNVGIQTNMYGPVVINMDGGEINCNTGIYAYNGPNDYTMTVNISGGAITAVDNAIMSYHSGTTVQISGGTLTSSTEEYAVVELYPYTNSAQPNALTISGGHLQNTAATEDYVVINWDAKSGTLATTASVNITDGLFDGDIYSQTDDAMTVSGGVFKYDPDIRHFDAMYDYYVVDNYTTIRLASGEHAGYYVVVPERTLTVNSNITGEGDFTINDVTIASDPIAMATNVISYNGTIGEGAQVQIEAADGLQYRQFNKWSDNVTDRVRTVTIGSVNVYQAIYLAMTLELTDEAIANPLSFVLDYSDCDTIIPQSFISSDRVQEVNKPENLNTEIRLFTRVNGVDYAYGTEESRVAPNVPITLVWKVFDSDNGNFIAETTEMLAVNFPPCGAGVTMTDGDGNTYESIRIGCDCWIQSNLKSETYANGAVIEFAKPYVSDNYPNAEENANTYGLLYTWASAVNVPENLSQMPKPDNDGYVQGACGNGWRLPTTADIMKLNDNDAADLRIADLWLDHVGNNASGFTLVPAGFFNSGIERYENLLGMTFLLGADSYTGTHVVKVPCGRMGCPIMILEDKVPTDGFSVRCIKK